jgi:large subunit ribosomal protein L15
VTPVPPQEVGLHTLTPKPGSRKARKRVGRGGGSGYGKTSGRGHKGAGARAGAKRKPGYEGGQNPIHMRTRKLRGPHRKMSMPFERFRTRTQPVNVADLEDRFDAGAEVTPESLQAAGLAKRRHPVKLLGRGELTKKLTVRVHAFSATARQKVEAAGGKCEVIEDAANPAAPDAGAGKGSPSRRRGHGTQAGDEQPAGSDLEEAAG